MVLLVPVKHAHKGPVNFDLETKENPPWLVLINEASFCTKQDLSHFLHKLYDLWKGNVFRLAARAHSGHKDTLKRAFIWASSCFTESPAGRRRLLAASGWGSYWVLTGPNRTVQNLLTDAYRLLFNARHATATILHGKQSKNLKYIYIWFKNEIMI